MTDNTAQKASASYRLPALDQDFLLGDSMRGVRLQLEYEKAEERLRAWVVRSTIVVFGSARALAPDPSAQILQLDEPTSLSHWYEEARRFGRIASERGGALIARDGLRDNVIATGGGPGIMEAANRGAAEAGVHLHLRKNRAVSLRDPVRRSRLPAAGLLLALLPRRIAYPYCLYSLCWPSNDVVALGVCARPRSCSGKTHRTWLLVGKACASRMRLPRDARKRSARGLEGAWLTDNAVFNGYAQS